MKQSAFLILMMLGLGLSPSRVQAFDYSGKFGVTGSVGLNTLAMDDVNNTLAHFGGNLSSGWEANIGLTYGISKSILANVGVGEIFNYDSFPGGNISLPALSIQGGGEYVLFPEITQGFDISIAGAVEYDMLDGNTSIDPGVIGAGKINAKTSGWGGGGGGGGGVPGGTAPSGATYILTNCVGSTVGAQMTLKGRYFTSPQFAFGIEAGYRYSHIYQVTGTTNGVSETEAETVDYSGAIGKITGNYYF